MTTKKRKPRATLSVLATAIDDLAKVAQRCDESLAEQVDALTEKTDDHDNKAVDFAAQINQLRSDLSRLTDSHAHTRQAVSRLAVQLHQTLQTANGANIRVSMLRDDFEMHCRVKPSAWERFKGWVSEKLDWGFGGDL